MFVIRDEDCEFIEYINGDTINTTRNLKHAIICNTIEEAKALKQYINIVNEYMELDIMEIVFKEVENV